MRKQMPLLVPMLIGGLLLPACETTTGDVQRKSTTRPSTVPTVRLPLVWVRLPGRDISPDNPVNTVKTVDNRNDKLVGVGLCPDARLDRTVNTW